VLVQTRELEVRLISDPAGMLPSLRSEPDVPRVTVLPLAVLVGVEGVVGRAIVRVGVGVLTTGRGVERAGADAAGATAVGVDVAGTSVSAGCAVES